MGNTFAVIGTALGTPGTTDGRRQGTLTGSAVHYRLVAMNGTINVTLQDGRQVSCPVGTSARDLLADAPPPPPGLHYLAALVNNDTASLSRPLHTDCTVHFLTLANPHGWRIYRRSVSFLLAKSVRECFPEASFSVEHSMGTGFYCNFDLPGQRSITQDQLAQIESHLRQLVDRNLPIERRKLSFEAALRRFESEGQQDKHSLLRFRNPPDIVVYECDGFSDLAHGPLAPCTGALDRWALIPYPPGFVLQFPDRENPAEVAPFESQPHLFQIFQEHKRWGRILGVETVGRLNEIIAADEADDFIKISEALHEKKIAQIADRIVERDPPVRWVLIAGPSSSGKTTFAQRLRVQLRVNGKQPVAISVDNYFVDRDQTPRDEAGDFDFEHIEALDLSLFNDHLRRLDRGEKVELPRFNFTEGRKEFHGDTLQIGNGQIVIIEGIHALNPRLTAELPAEHKFHVYVSALTQLNLDANNRISTTDNRLIRRMVRDHQFRGHSALATLERWHSVRRGEKRWIFPFQQEADVVFNSALEYELAVLKPLAEPLLSEVKPMHPQYAEARRLMDFLGCFLAIGSGSIYPNSILREFVGQSAFRY